jgi:protein-S-isoprenylcysteine O-methyltransferase Ste14
MQIEDDSPQVRFPPPFVYAGMLMLGFLIGSFIGRPSIGLDIVVGSSIGLALLVGGTAIMVAAGLLFRKVGNNLEPWRSATTIVSSGVYRFTRNPMYLGMALIFAGLAMVFDGLAALMLLPVVVIIIQTQVIAREERYLEEKFGDDYRAYKNKVSRWI